MSADDQDRRTEEPTERHLRRAREQGEVARSRDVSGFAVLAGVLLVLWLNRDAMVAQLHELGRLALSAPQAVDAMHDGFAPQALLWRFASILARLCAPVIVVAVVVAIAVNVAQTRALFAMAAVVPKFERLNPVQGLKELFSRRSLVELLKSLVKMAVLGAGLAWVVVGALPALVQLPYAPLPRVALDMARVLGRFFFIGLMLFAFVAVFDHWFQRIDHLRRQRMTPEELKRERREDEGDPQLRQERRSLAREALLPTLMERARSASLIVHDARRDVAVAVIIDPQGGFTPWVVHKGRGAVARSLVDLAHRQPIASAVDGRLARHLMDTVQVDADLDARTAERVVALWSR